MVFIHGALVRREGERTRVRDRESLRIRSGCEERDGHKIGLPIVYNRVISTWNKSSKTVVINFRATHHQSFSSLSHPFSQVSLLLRTQVYLYTSLSGEYPPTYLPGKSHFTVSRNILKTRRHTLRA